MVNKIRYESSEIYDPQEFIESIDDIEKKRKECLDILEIDKLPTEISISTITITCSVDTTFDKIMIPKYIDTNENGIVRIRNGKNKKKKTNLETFQNQVSLDVRVKSKKETLNVKLFLNGSIQITGSKSVEDFINTMLVIFKELRKSKAILDKKTMKINDIKFGDKIENLKISNIKNFKIGMINSNFNLGFGINQHKLYELLSKDKYTCRYYPSGHSSVNIKHEYMGEITSLLVFDKGSIIITGAKNCGHILNAYEFINKYILKYHQQIVKNNIIADNVISKYLIKKEEENEEKKIKNNQKIMKK